MYSGSWENDNFHSSGTYTWEDGEKYVGEFQNGKRNSYGKLILANGNIQEGIYINDVIQKNQTNLRTATTTTIK